MLSSVIFCLCGCLCGCCCFRCCQKCRSRRRMQSQINDNMATCTLMSDKEVQMPSPQIKRPKPPRPPPPIYEYVPPTRPSADVDMKTKVSMGEEQTPEASETNEQCLDVNMNEEKSLEIESDKNIINEEEGLELKENVAYQKIVAKPMES